MNVQIPALPIKVQRGDECYTGLAAMYSCFSALLLPKPCRYSEHECSLMKPTSAWRSWMLELAEKEAAWLPSLVKSIGAGIMYDACKQCTSTWGTGTPNAIEFPWSDKHMVLTWEYMLKMYTVIWYSRILTSHSANASKNRHGNTCNISAIFTAGHHVYAHKQRKASGWAR